MIEQFAQMIQSWNVDLYAGWSIMDIATLLILLLMAERLINYFFFKAGS